MIPQLSIFIFIASKNQSINQFYRFINQKSFIMQVRKSLHSKHNDPSNKYSKNLVSNMLKDREKVFLKSKKINPKRKKTKSRSKSRSISIKENRARDKSKSFQKISPFKKIKNEQILFTSPISKSKKKTKKSNNNRTPLVDLSTRRLNTEREHQKISHGISTKINTERSPLIINYSHNEYSFQHKKGKISEKKVKIEKFNTKIKTQRSKQKKKTKKTLHQKNKSKIPQIKTQLPKRKESYFDEIVLDNIKEINNNEFMSSGLSDPQKSLTLQTHFISNKKQNNFTSNSKEADNTFDFPLTNQRFKTETSRQFGTSTREIDFKKQMLEKIEKLEREEMEKIKETYRNQISIRQIESFRREQQLKWKIISLELENVKNKCKPEIPHESEKLDDALKNLVEVSEKNLEEMKEKQSKIIQENTPFILSKQAYILESPKKVREALALYKNRRNSQEQKLELIKNVSNKQLISDLEFMKDGQAEQQESSLQKFYVQKLISGSQTPLQKFDSNGTAQKQSQEQSNSKSFCLQFQKQLENYVMENKQEKKKIRDVNQEFFNLEIQYIPELEYNKALEVVVKVENDLMEEFCAELITSDYLLHSFLTASKEQTEYKERIYADNFYAQNLMKALFEFLLKSENADKFQEFIRNINIPYGSTPEMCLKWLRNLVNEDNSAYLESSTENYTSPVPILSVETISQFDMTTYIVESHSQYFMNHSIYSCLNQLLDRHRPYGTSGLPPLERRPPEHLIYDEKTALKMLAKVEVEFENLLKLRVGRMDFNDGNMIELPNSLIQAQIIASLKGLDEYLIQEDTRWQGMRKSIGNGQICQEFVFENKHLISQIIAEEIINEEVLMIYTDFIQ